MRYQIQKYRITDYADRVVIAEESFDSQDAANAWGAQVISGLPEEAGFQYATVIEQHHWFIQSVTPAQQATPELSKHVLMPMERELVPFEECARHEIQASLRRRQEAHQAQLNLQQNMAKLMQ